METLSGMLALSLEEQRARGLVHTPREIAQQPATWLQTLRLFARERTKIESYLEQAGVYGPLQDRPAVLLIGAGTSDYVGQSLALLLRKQWGCEVTACASTDLLPKLDRFLVPGRRYLAISFSRSGDSPEGVAILEEAAQRYPHVSHLLVTCNPAARMKALCDAMRNAFSIVLDDAVNDRGLAMTSSFTNMVIAGHCLAHMRSWDAYQAIAAQLQAAGVRLLAEGDAVAAGLADRRLPRACFVGSGSLAAVARESALKVLEMSAGRVKTMAETTLGLRHGPMAALDQKTLFACFLSGEAGGLGYGLDLLREVTEKRITAVRVAVGPARAAAQVHGYCDLYLPICEEIADEYRPAVDVLFGQMLGLRVSIANDFQPDTPSPDGVINRVVQSFAIHR